MHSGALRAQRGCQARGAPQSSGPRAVFASSVASSMGQTATPAPTTAKKFFYGVSDSPLSLAHPEVVIVHERRRAGLEGVIPAGAPVRELLKADCFKTVVSVSAPEEAADALAAAVSAPFPRLAALVRADCLRIAKALSSGALPAAGRFSAKLEICTRETCPKWHSDYVGCRCLVTYAGKGTLFAPPEAVLSAEEARRRRTRRRRERRGNREDENNAAGSSPSFDGGIPVDESLVLQAEPFDLLFLKGRASAAAVGAAAAAARSPLQQWLLGSWGGGGGGGGGNLSQGRAPLPPRSSSSSSSLLAVGAVHKSPAEASEESPRLVLTIDDACECCVGG